MLSKYESFVNYIPHNYFLLVNGLLFNLLNYIFDKLMFLNFMKSIFLFLCVCLFVFFVCFDCFLRQDHTL